MKHLNSSKPVEWIVCDSTGIESCSKIDDLKKCVKLMNNVVEIFGKFCDDVADVGCSK